MVNTVIKIDSIYNEHLVKRNIKYRNKFSIHLKVYMPYKAFGQKKSTDIIQSKYYLSKLFELK